MYKNPLHVYGDGALSLPSHLNLGQFLIETLWSHGDKVALINGATDEKLTYRRMVKEAMNVANSLTRMGIKKGDTIAICSESRQEFWSTFIGISCAGAIMTPVSMMYTKDELKHVLNISKPKFIVCSPFAYKSHGDTLKSLHFIENIILYGNDRLPNTLPHDDLVRENLDFTVDNFVSVDVKGQMDTAIILYSSGTSGLPKGVMLTHLNALVTCSLSSTVDPRELSLLLTPWYHTMGLMGILRVFASGGSIVYIPKYERNLLLKTIEHYRIVSLILPPPVLVALSKDQSSYDVSSVKLIYSGAAPLRSDTIEAIKQRFPNISHVLQGYGMTETTLAVTRDTYDKAHLSKAGGVGRPVSSIILKIADLETRKTLGPHESGEICVKGPFIMKGYVGKELSDEIDDEGFYKTGDIGYFDDDKCLFVVDRLKELIKYKGFQVPPAEIESVLTHHPGILDAAVIGIPDDSAGEVPRAYVVLQPGANLSEEDVKNIVAEKLSNPKHLRGGVRFVKEIPKVPSGKILRRKLRETAKMEEVKSKL